MKSMLYLLAIQLVVGLHADARTSYEIAKEGAMAKVTIKVVDQDGAAVSDAKVWGGFTTGDRIDDFMIVDGYTNTNGLFTTESRCNESMRVVITKEGYYRSEERVNFWHTESVPSVVDDKWQPYGETRTVVLKRIKNLGVLVVPDMSRCTRIDLKIPKYGCWIAFDLEKYDWVMPYGSGVCSDVLLRFRRRSTQKWYDFTDCMDICFTNSPFAGAYEMKKERGSDIHTVYEADPNSSYEKWFAFKCEQTSDRKKTYDYLKDDSYLVYRIRTKVDEDGKLKSAHYGIISGMWMSAKCNMIMADGCFNPQENDLNVEDGYYLREKVRHYHDRD